MRASVLLALCIAVYTASGVPLEGTLEERVYPRFIEVEDSNGLMHEIDLEATPDMALVEEITGNPTNNRYLLYTRNNPTDGQPLFINIESSITESNFNPELPTVVIVHGWLVNETVTISSSLRDAFLEKEDANVIVLDWTSLALQDYATASAGTPAVGRDLGNFLAFLQDTTGASYGSMHLVGFSLGAHAIGNAGRELDGNIGRITGLDPAGPLWTLNDYRLSRDDAVYVENIHTNGGSSGLGIGFSSGDVDFFPNGGVSQPGCFTRYCHHNRAWELFEATVKYDHLIGNECTNLLEIATNTCRGQSLNMGNSIINKSGSGMYRVNTGHYYPF